MTKTKQWTTFAGALALTLAVVAAPAAFSQQEEPQAGDAGMHRHHGQMGEMPADHAERMAEHQAMMAEHQAEMEAHLARMDELIAEMNRATGDAKTDAVAAVLTEMWSHHQSMQDGMGMMGCMGMMGGHGMMKGHGAMGDHEDCGCPMHGEGEAHACAMHGEGEAHACAMHDDGACGCAMGEGMSESERMDDGGR